MSEDSSRAADSEPSFEASLSELQRIVDDLETGALGLEESLQQFERGTGLLRRCYAILEQAERRIEILTGRTADGEPVCEPFDGSPTHQPEEAKPGRRPRNRE